jgi:general secretion pathway protein N
MRAAPALALGLVAYGAFLVGTLPARLVTDRVEAMTAGGVDFDRVEGSAWAGRATVRVRAGGGDFALDEVSWRFLPARLLAGEAAFAVTASRPGLEATGVAARSLGETRVRALKATGTAAALVPLFPLAAGWQPEGTITFESDEFALGRDEARGAAKAEWRDAALSLAPSRPLGTWKADFAGKGNAVEVALATVKGPLRLAGKGTVTFAGGKVSVPFSLAGTASADPGREKELEALLALIGPRRPDGLHAFTVR